LTESEFKKLNSENLSPQDEQAIMNKIMLGKTNISMKEVEKLEKMSPEGQKKWAEGTRHSRWQI